VLQQAIQAMADNQTSPQGAIDDFVSRVAALRTGTDPNATAAGTPAATGSAASGHGLSAAAIVAIAVVVLAALSGGGLLIARRRPDRRSGRRRSG
jgi:hypothetical protein